MGKTIRSALPNKSGRPSFTKDTDALANEFNRFFISVGQKAAYDSAELARLHGLPTTPVYLGSTHCDELFDFKAITSEDVRKVIMAMPSNKAPGYDRIPVFVIKDYLPYILPTLTALINLINSSPYNKHIVLLRQVIPRSTYILLKLCSKSN